MNHINWQPGMTLEHVEKSAILQAFRYYGGIQTATANALGITTRTLYNKLQQYGMKGLENGNPIARPTDIPKPKYDANGRLSGDYALDNPNRIVAGGTALGAPSGSGPQGRSASESGASSGDGKGSAERGTNESATESSEQGQTEERTAVGVHAESGLGREPNTQVAAQQSVPLRNGQEVQSVLPKQNATGSSKRR